MYLRLKPSHMIKPLTAGFLLASLGILAQATNLPSNWQYCPIVQPSCVVYSPDGSLIAVSGPGGVQILNVNSGAIQCLATPTAPSSFVSNSVAFSKDNQTLIVGTNASQIQFYKASTGAFMSSVQTSVVGVSSVALSPDGSQFAVGGVGINASNQRTGLIEVWSYAAKKKTKSFTSAASMVPGSTISSVSFSKNGKFLADGGLTIGQNSTKLPILELWDLKSGQLSSSLASSENTGITSVTFSPDSTMLVAGGMSSQGGMVELWSVSTLKLASTFPTGATNAVRWVSFSPDGKSVGVAGQTVHAVDTLETWDPKTSQLVNSFDTNGIRGITSLAFSPNSKSIADTELGIAGINLSVRNIATSSVTSTFNIADSAKVSAIVFSPDGKTLLEGGRMGISIYGSPTGLLETWNPATGRRLQTLTTRANLGVTSVAYAPSGSQFAVGGIARTVQNNQSVDQGVLEIWNTKSTEPSAMLATQANKAIMALAFSTDGNTLILGGASTEGGVLEFWNLSTHSLVMSPVTPFDGGITSLVLSPDGMLVYCSGNSSTHQGLVEVRSTTTGAVVGTIHSTANLSVSKIEVSPNGKFLAIAGASNASSAPGVAEIWDTNTLHYVRKLVVGSEPVMSSIAFSPFGNAVYVGSGKFLRAYAMTSGVLLATYGSGTGLLTTSIAAGLVGTGSDAGILSVANAPLAVTASLSSFTVTSPVVASGDPAFYSIKLTGPAPAGGLTVDLSGAQGTNIPDSVTIPSGLSSLNFSAPTIPVATTTVVQVSAKLGNVSKSMSFTIQAPQLVSLTIRSGSVQGGTSVTGTVTISAGAPSDGLTFNLSSNNSAAKVPQTVTIPFGLTSATFTIQTSTVSHKSTVTIKATNGSQNVTGNVTIS